MQMALPSPLKRGLAEIEEELSQRLLQVMQSRSESQGAAESSAGPSGRSDNSDSDIPVPLLSGRIPAGSSGSSLSSGPFKASEPPPPPPPRSDASRSVSGSVGPEVVEALAQVMAKVMAKQPQAGTRSRNVSRQASLAAPATSHSTPHKNTPSRRNSSRASEQPTTPFTAKAIQLVQMSRAASGESLEGLGPQSNEVKALKSLMKQAMHKMVPDQAPSKAARPAAGSKPAAARKSHEDPSKLVIISDQKAGPRPARAKTPSPLRGAAPKPPLATSKPAASQAHSHQVVTSKGLDRPTKAAAGTKATGAPSKPAAQSLRSSSRGRSLKANRSPESFRTPERRGRASDGDADAGAARKKPALPPGARTAKRQARLQRLYSELMKLDIDSL